MENPAMWWLVLGIGLLVVEMLTGTMFFLFICAGAFLVALLSWQTAIGLEMQAMVFAAATVAGVLAWRKVRPNPDDSLEQRSGAAGLNNRLARFVGREAVLEQGISNGRGRVRLDDSYWDVAGAELPAGARVRVVAVEGMTLRVEPV
jgi:membrane protein implicated in regulation of membrane protease activity